MSCLFPSYSYLLVFFLPLYFSFLFTSFPSSLWSDKSSRKLLSSHYFQQSCTTFQLPLLSLSIKSIQEEEGQNIPYLSSNKSRNGRSSSYRQSMRTNSNNQRSSGISNRHIIASTSRRNQSLEREEAREESYRQVRPGPRASSTTSTTGRTSLKGSPNPREFAAGLNPELLETFIRHSPSEHEAGLLWSFHGLVKASEHNDTQDFTKELKTLGAKVVWQVHPALFEFIIPLLEQRVDEIEGEALSDWLWSLGRLGFDVNDPKQTNLILFLVHSVCIEKNITGRMVTTALGGLFKLGVKWSRLNGFLQEEFFNCVVKVAGEFNAREISNVMYYLGKMMVNVDMFPPKVTQSLIGAVLRNREELAGRQGAMSLYSLGKLSFNVASLHPEDVEVLLQISQSALKTIISDAKRGNTEDRSSQQVSNALYGMAKMGIKYDMLNEELLRTMEEALLATCTMMNAQEVANNIYSFGLMHIPWVELQPEAQACINNIVSSHLHRVSAQGLSMTIYGMSFMGIRFNDMSARLRQVIQTAVQAHFSTRRLNPGMSCQSVANVIYAFGLMGVVWDDLDEETRNVLLDATILCGDYFNTQELSNIVYGLGLMRAQFLDFPLSFQTGFTECLHRIEVTLNPQEVCSMLHGMARMIKNWSHIPRSLQTFLIQSIRDFHDDSKDDRNIPTACVIYSLGHLAVNWQEDLPVDIQKQLIQLLQKSELRDQALSNTIYGLGNMQLHWDEMTVALKRAIINLLTVNNGFSLTIAQHISNTLWGLCKMNAGWKDLPRDTLQSALSTFGDYLNVQDSANVFYALASMDATWDELDSDVLEALLLGLKKGKIIPQELSNVMYAMALLSFDSIDNDILSYDPNSKEFEAICRDHPRKFLLYRWHQFLNEKFAKTPSQLYCAENYEQFAIYYAMVCVLPGGRDLVMQYLDEYPQVCGPSATVPSRLHARISMILQEEFDASNTQLTVFNEFNGLGGIFPVDVAIYDDQDDASELVAFVEVDGDFHYRSITTYLAKTKEGSESSEQKAAREPRVGSAKQARRLKQLLVDAEDESSVNPDMFNSPDDDEEHEEEEDEGTTIMELIRKDQLKEFIYRTRYPHVQFYRLKLSDIHSLGARKIAGALGKWIIFSYNNERKAVIRDRIS